jgi:hypothetical protein
MSNVVPSSSILVTLMMEALRSSETSVIKIVTQRNIPEDGIINTNIIIFVFLPVAISGTIQRFARGRKKEYETYEVTI